MISKTHGFSKNLATLALLILITGHAFLMNGYFLSHRYLTVDTYVSQIRALADPSLFKNSVYVQAVNRTNLRIGLFYYFAPFILKHFDFETFALIQAIISLFFVLAGIYTLTKHLFKSSTAGYIAALLYTTKLNIWAPGAASPFLNFFHHGLPYTYPLIVWSMVFFFKKNTPLHYSSQEFHGVSIPCVLSLFSFHFLSIGYSI